jgi:hypothetical protein
LRDGQGWVRECVPGLSLESLQARTAIPLQWEAA